MLTKRQKNTLDFIKAQVEATGVTPSIREIAAGLGIKSSASVSRILLILEERQFIRRVPNRARCIQLIPPETAEIAALKAEHDRRVTELLNANTQLVNRARTAEEKLRRHGLI